MRRVVVACMAVLALLGAGTLPAASSPPANRGAPARAPLFKVGAASRSVLPLVDGGRAYLDDAALPGTDDVDSPGVFVEAFDAGRVAVGNGHPDAHWVRDDLRVRAVAVEELRGGRDGKEIVVMAATDLYMIFRADAEVIRERALAQLDPSVRNRVDIAIGATHNHHGPDTAFDVNHVWYDQMMDEVAAAIVEAVQTRRPARLSVADGELWYGMRDSRDPQVIDPTMNVLQATATDGDVIATVVQWNNHPEVTLGWTPTEDRTADCTALDEASPCTRNRYFTADFTGHMARTIEAEVGGVAPIFVGALGGLVTPLRAAIWEVTDDVGLGNQFDPPPGAQPAGNDTSFTEANFRRAVVLGEQGARYALDLLEGAEVITDGTLSYETVDVFTRMSHIGFRLLSVVDPDTGWTSLGHTPGQLYTCPALGPKDASTCEPDDFATVFDPVLETEIRAGDHARTEVAYLRLGPVGMMWLPAEMAGELVIGLPAGFDASPETWFDESTDLHAAGEDLDTPGYVRGLMTDEYRWTIGLGNDELGYAVPLSDWRVLCVAGAENCAALHQMGAIAYPDSLAGEQCKAVVEDRFDFTGYPAEVEQAIRASCRYGQAFGEAESHYEETNSVGWDLAADILTAVATLTGAGPSGRINPDFAGFWSGHPPPAP